MAPAPRLEGDALRAVEHRGSHLQIIASAGSGKTEVVSQRVVDLLADDVSADGIVAFTFTERAAAELKHRIAERVEERLGRSVLDGLNGLFVGTIHAYCFRLLQVHVPRFESYDVLDDNQLTAFLAREANRLEIRQFDGRGRMFGSIARFLESVSVVENELLDPDTMPEPFRSVLLQYLASLDRYRLLTYGQQIAHAVAALENPLVRSQVHETLRHLIVDEYQDVNPAQERLVELLADGPVELCVVGDDDQAIYQWRGSDVANIVTFRDRYSPVATFEITTNRRSRPDIIESANEFVQSVVGRLDKTMGTSRPSGSAPEVVAWTGETEAEEAGWIAQLVLDLHESGVPFRDIAVLVRGRVSYPALLDAFATFDIPVQPAGRTGLFDRPEARVIGRAFAWLAGIEWRDPYSRGALVGDDELLDEFAIAFTLDQPSRNRLRSLLQEWKSTIPRKDRTADLVGELYELFAILGVQRWDLTDPVELNRMGTLARFTALLADYETVRRRARPDPEIEGEQVGGEDRGSWYYKNLAIHIVNFAQGSYEGFDGESDFDLDAVDLTTVHRAKGLEWPAVFVPSVTSRRFPSSMNGTEKDWLIPRSQFAAERYEGADVDERRLFYVAMTRARDWLSLSRHARTKKRAAAPSPYFSEIQGRTVEPGDIRLPDFEPRGSSEEAIELTFSELSVYLDCAMAYRLRNLLGFQPRLATELGYGRAVHHVLRTIAEQTRATGRVPSSDEIDTILDRSFFLPTANKPAHRQLKAAGRRLVAEYAASHADDLRRVWETERPFELRLDGITVSGRADVILDNEGGSTKGLAILDYKTSTIRGADHGLQLQVYADAGLREGLEVRGAYVHDLKAGARSTVDVSSQSIEDAEARISEAAVRLRNRDYTPAPGKQCRRCEVRSVCGSAKA